ncbi:MFS transporter [Siccirubricoccus deserti]
MSETAAAAPGGPGEDRPSADCGDRRQRAVHAEHGQRRDHHRPARHGARPGVEPARLGVAITSYLVALTVFIPVSGWMADRFGAKRVFMVAIAIFTCASALCARSTGLPELIAARVLQGFGGAMMVPVARLLLLRQVRKDQMLSAMTWLTVPAMIGPISGPPLGGFLTDAFGWRSVFLINLPIGVLGLALVAWKIPRIPPGDPGPPDLPGLVLLGLALALSMFGLETLGRG